MRKIETLEGKTIPLGMNNIDTDLIIPARYLTSVSRQGYSRNLFQNLADKDENFVFKQAQYHDASILISGDNFGCGSSREHAVWALQEAGIEAIVAVSFADIFKNNVAKNGLLSIELPQAIIDKLLEKAPEVLRIELSNQIIKSEQETFSFKMESFVKYCFINGLDEMDYILKAVKTV